MYIYPAQLLGTTAGTTAIFMYICPAQLLAQQLAQLLANASRIIYIVSRNRFGNYFLKTKIPFELKIAHDAGIYIISLIFNPQRQ